MTKYRPLFIAKMTKTHKIFIEKMTKTHKIFIEKMTKHLHISTKISIFAAFFN